MLQERVRERSQALQGGELHAIKKGSRLEARTDPANHRARELQVHFTGFTHPWDGLTKEGKNKAAGSEGGKKGAGGSNVMI